MLEALKIIAVLCQMSAGDDTFNDGMADRVEERQKKCHSYYAKCIKPSDISRSLVKCMIQRSKPINRIKK